MVAEKAAQLTAQFYEWELLGRGWLHAQEPVELEPEFTPFFGHFLIQPPPVDDGMHHTLLSKAAALFRSQKQQPLNELPPQVSYNLFPYHDDDYLIAYQPHLSKQSFAKAHEVEQLLTMLSYCTNPVSFEIIGRKEGILFYLVCRSADERYIKSQLQTYFHNTTLVEKEIDDIQFVWEGSPCATVDYGLQEEFMRPLAHLRTVTTDSFTGILSLMEHLEENEQVIYQVLCNGVCNHWESSILRSVSGKKGEPFFEDAPKMLPLAKEKVTSTICAATVRLLTQAPTITASFALLEKVSFALCTTVKSQYNALRPLIDSTYSIENRISDIMYRTSCRAGMLLNTKELASFIHIPEAALISKKLLGDTRKTKQVPLIAQGHRLLLGKNIHAGIETEVTIADEQRLKHTHIIGATGTGKSTLLSSLICQDIAQGEGVAVLDPHGDLIDTILAHIPHTRINDVIVIDPSDTEYPVSFNILKAHSDIEREVLSSDLVTAFRKYSTSWGDQMNSVFANAILAFLENTKGGTLVDLRRFLIEKPYRESFLQSVSDPSIVYYWKKEYPLLKTNSIGAILTRLDAFLRPRLIRNMVAQEKGIDFEAVLNQKKILLVKLSQGLIGAENSYLLGSFVVSKINQAALARQETINRPNFFVYIDEFQHFITPSLAHMLSGARKYHVGLTLAHQDIQQVQKQDGEVLHSLLSNAGTRICFRSGDADAKRLAEGFSFFESKDIQNLNTGEAIVRIEKPENDFSLATIPFQSVEEAYAHKEDVIERSRNTYSTPKAEVEKLVHLQIAETIEEEKPPILQQQKVVIKEETKPTPVQPVERAVPVIDDSKIEAENRKVMKRKEETQHRYLQNLIKKMAESKGYRAVIESVTPDGKGKVDVVIAASSITIACEVSVTTDCDWELHNVQKCVAAGYTAVFVCCTNNNTMEALQKKVAEAFDESVREKIVITSPDGLFTFLDSITVTPSPTETTMKGYRVKVEYDSLSQDEIKRKQESISKIVLDSLRKMKK